MAEEDLSRIYDWSAHEALRRTTVAGLRDLRRSGRRLAQVTANSAVEAAAAEAAGIEMAVTRARNVVEVRAAAPHLFLTAALGFAEAVTPDDILRAAFKALSEGADAVITARGMATVSMLAAEDIPVMGHLGLVPRKSTWVGKLRAVGKTGSEAFELYHRFRRLEEAGAFAVECELIPAQVMSEIQRRTGLVTVSLGSGPAADVIFLFTEDICGEAPRVPRHARAYADLGRLQAELAAERLRALQEFRRDVGAESFPGPENCAAIGPTEHAAFLEQLDRET